MNKQKYGWKFSGALMREARKAKGMTLEGLEELTGISETQLSKYENEKNIPGLSVAMEIAMALETLIDCFMVEVKQDKPCSIE